MGFKFKLGPLEIAWGMTKRSSKWPSYCRMCMRRDGLDPYEADGCSKHEDCEHYPFSSFSPLTSTISKKPKTQPVKKVPSVVKGSSHGGR